MLEHFKYAFIVEILKYLIWILAALGILYQQLFHERYKQIETLFYVLIAFLPATLIILFGHEFLGMFELKIGGIIYLTGVIFFKCDGRMCCAHAIWHVFVSCAASIHYFAILKYLYSDQNIHQHMTIN
jgi:monocyte to macrophage differentiation protein